MICVITETWLSNEENDLRYKEIPPPGYKILSKPHKSGKKGGGIAVVYKASLNMKECCHHYKLVKSWNAWNSPPILKVLCVTST